MRDERLPERARPDPQPVRLGEVNVSVAYLDTKQRSPQASCTIASVSTAWTLAAPVNINPSSASGWQLAQFTFAAANSGEYQLSNFYVDPKMRH